MNTQELSKYQTSIHDSKAFAIGDDARVFYVEYQHINTAPPPVSRQQLLEAIYSASGQLRHYYPTEIAGIHLERAEVGQIVEWVQNAEPKKSLGLLGMLLDKPGGGKTVVMRDVLVELEAAGMPVLAIKADMLSGIKNRTDLADRLGLPASVEECAHILASEGLFFVLLDQLDALSLTLSRDQSTLNVMLSTLSRLRAIPNVRILASCRTFDLNNDPHLSTIKVDRKFDLRPLDSEQVNRVLRAIGINPAHLLPEHRKLLATPLHLYIYARIVTSEAPEQTPESYRSLQELYEALWKKRIVAIPPHTPSPTLRIKAIYKLVEVMENRRQPKLKAPLGVLDEYPDAKDYLEREQIIRQEKSHWLFFHQTFFDYCYARRFVAKGRCLSEEILASSQGLFERSLMVQVLAYLRGSDEMAYRREVRQLLFSDDLRTHLRLLLIGWFGSLLNPSAKERRIAGKLMKKTDDLKHFLQRIGGNTGWFDLLKEHKLPSLLSADDENLLDMTIRYLRTMIEPRTEAVLALLRPYLDQSEAWNRRIAFCLVGLHDWQNDEALDLFCELLHRGHTAGWEGVVFGRLAESNPAGECRALAVYLDHRLKQLLEEEQRLYEAENSEVGSRTNLFDRRNLNKFLFEELNITKMLKKAVKVCPHKLLEHLLPWFVETTIVLGKQRYKEGYPSDPLFTRGWYEQHITGGIVFAKRITEALKQLARTDPTKFRSHTKLLVTIESLAVQRVLMHAYLANPETYADDIFEYLVGDKRRLSIGEDMKALRYDSCQLVGAAFQYLSAERRADLEELILGWQPAWERRNRGFGQLYFLKGIPLELLSETTQHKRRELERKFPPFELRPPQRVSSVSVGSPILPVAQAKMSDEDWLNAMRKYDDSTAWGGPHESSLKGGAVELSRAFAEQVKKEPERFYRLAQRFHKTISLYYVETVISGLAESDAPAEWVFDLTRQFMSHLEGDFQRGVCRALQQRAKDGVPDDLLDLMTDWALNDPDPLPDESGQQLTDSNDAHFLGINSNRGSAILAVCHCALQHNPPQVERAFQLFAQAADDPSTAVRTCVVESLGPLLNEDDTRTLTIFEQTLNGHPHLLQSPLVHRFLYWVYYRHFPRIRPFIEALLANEDDATRQAGARLACLACLAAFQYPEASTLVEQIMQGDAAMRRGAAQVYARNLAHSNFGVICQQQLSLLMHDPDEQVRINVSECFEHLQSEDVDHLQPFIEQFLASPSLLARPYHLIDYLTPLATEEHDLVLLATEHILDCVEIAELSWRGHEVVCLPLAVYNYATDPATKSRAMDLFERLLLLGSSAAQQALVDWDRR